MNADEAGAVARAAIEDPCPDLTKNIHLTVHSGMQWAHLIDKHFEA